MFLFVNSDGTVTQAPDSFDVKNPDWVMLKDVDEVLQISTVYTKQLKLVAKSKDERDRIKQAVVEAPAAMPIGPIKRTRREKK